MQISGTRLQIAFTILTLSVMSWLSSEAVAKNSLAGTDAPSLRSVAFEHYLSGDSDAALDYYQKAVDIAIHDYGQESTYVGELYYEMGTLALDAKKFMKAESYLQKAVQQNPNSVMARVKFAELLQLRGKNDEALQQIKAAISKHNNAPEAREALVLWLQSNGQKARAIHESYALSEAIKGGISPPVMIPAAKPAPAETKVALATAAPIPVPDKNSPLMLRLPWMSDKKPEVKKPPEPKKPPAAKKEPVKKETKPAKPAKPAKEKPPKHPAKAKETRPTTPVTAAVELHAQEAAALKTTAKKLPKKEPPKKIDDSGESDPAESKPDDSPREEAKPKSAPKKIEAPKPQPPVQMPTRVETAPRRNGKPPSKMVPPPPPMAIPIPGYPMNMAPMGWGQTQQQQAPKPKAKPAAKEVAKETPPPESKPPSASSSSSSSEDPEFILDWAGTNKKKKAK